MKFSFKDIAKFRQKPLVSCGMPPKGRLFRIHPDACFRDATVLYEPGKKSWYLIGSRLLESGGTVVGTHGAHLYQAQDEFGNDWVVVATLTSPGLVDVMEKGKALWTERLMSDKLSFQARSDYLKEPLWPDHMGFETVLNQAFEGRFLDGMEHPFFQSAELF